MKMPIETTQAPAAIGNYSQAVVAGKTIYLSGQIPLDPLTMTLVSGDIKMQMIRLFENLKSVLQAGNATLDSVVKLTVYLTDIAQLSIVNEVMTQYFKPPYPARTSIGVLALPKGAVVEIDAIAVL